MPGTACSLLAGWEHLPFPRLPRKTPQQRGAKRNPGDSDPAWSKPMAERQQSGTGIHWRKPRPPCLHWLGTLCCWGSVPLTRRQFELSDALVGVCAGSEPRARVPEPNPRVVVAVHSSEIIPKQTAEHRHRGCPLPGSPQGPRAASLQTPPALGGPGSSLWVEPGGVAVQSGLLNERVLLKRPMFITCNKATASNPSCTGNCCFWHGQHGAVRALGWEFCVIPEGSRQSSQHNQLSSYTSTGPSLTQWAMPLEASVPSGIVWLWGAQHCSVSRSWWLREHTVSLPFTKGYPERPRGSRMLGLNLCLFPPSHCLHRAAPQLHSWEHHGAGICKSFVPLHTASSNAGPFKQTLWCQNRSFMILR